MLEQAGGGQSLTGSSLVATGCTMAMYLLQRQPITLFTTITNSLPFSYLKKLTRMHLKRFSS